MTDEQSGAPAGWQEGQPTESGWKTYTSTTADGSKSITRDAVVGQLTQFGLAVGATAALGALNALDLTTLPGWLLGAGTLATTTAIGFLTNYLAKRKK